MNYTRMFNTSKSIDDLEFENPFISLLANFCYKDKLNQSKESFNNTNYTPYLSGFSLSLYMSKIHLKVNDIYLWLNFDNLLILKYEANDWQLLEFDTRLSLLEHLKDNYSTRLLYIELPAVNLTLTSIKQAIDKEYTNIDNIENIIMSQHFEDEQEECEQLSSYHNDLMPYVPMCD